MITQERLNEVARLCGRHHDAGEWPPPPDQRSRELWGLVEILDFECWRYDDSPTNITRDEAQEYLLAHKAELLALEWEPPSYLGLVTGVLDFLEGDAS